MAKAILADAEASGIYQIRNLVNGKRYIGSAKCFRIRWNGHRAKLNRGVHHSRHLQSAWNKYGPEAFAFEVIELCGSDSLVAREQHWLDGARPDYNVCPNAGNTLGRRLSDESREKIRTKAVGRKLGPRSQEHRRKLSAVHAGKKKPAHVMRALQAGRLRHALTEEQRSALSDSVRRGYEDGTRVREKTETHKNRIGQAFATLTDDSVREIRRLRSEGVTGRELSKMYGSNPGTISEICSGKRYRWVA